MWIMFLINLSNKMFILTQHKNTHFKKKNLLSALASSCIPTCLKYKRFENLHLFSQVSPETDIEVQTHC